MQYFLRIIAFLFIFSIIYACSVKDLEKYNSDFNGKWRTKIYYSVNKQDSIRNYLTVDGHNSGFGIACDKDDPFSDCMFYETGKMKYNTANKGIQIGNSVAQIHTVTHEPHINESGYWVLEIDSIKYYKY